MKPQPITTAYDLTTGRGRLRYLADEVLARVTREKLPFDIRDWVADYSRSNDCETAACACGWAARDPLFQAQGLSIDNNDLLVAGSAGFEALPQFFGLDEGTFGFFFLWDAYDHNPTAADVADRIRAYLAETEGV